MKRLDHPVLVTGATSGLGHAIALHLCQQGVRVLAGYRKDADAVRIAQSLGEHATPVRIDIALPDSVSQAAQWVAEQTPEGLSGLVNNAGIAIAGPLEAIPPADIEQQFEVNVVGAIRTTQALLPLLRQGAGRVVHIGSASGSFALPFVGPYAASKFAMEAIADAMRRELRPLGTRVILIRPGRMATDIFDRAEADAIDRFEHLSVENRDRYEPVLRRFQSLLHRSSGARCDPRRVAQAVARALTVRWPRARYNVGIDAHFSVQVAKWVPDCFSDWVVGRIIRA